jgi:hypothetical protein
MKKTRIKKSRDTVPLSRQEGRNLPNEVVTQYHADIKEQVCAIKMTKSRKNTSQTGGAD